ncbi:HEAT repeat domain-containing protein [Methanocella arvoryzae]|uniref:HEAT repeat domain-containing protein n=1 Tax=Methanocella arvoryzae (strain DSM 22066 / NBRC 105507 / MRE50) TaxID=351160 RepID=Q0W859_METAR|nr:HEAT repeat domain-containing protein [Methanocella arvoryzae]CAJ35434.1 hypothetical protein LRC487 [Methanocella arvoryzae MRE50]
MVEYPSASWNQQRMQEALKSPELTVKMSALRVLQEVPKDEYVQALMNSLEDPDRLVRINAAIALGKIRNPQATIPLIRHAVTDPDREVQSYALWAFRQIDYSMASQQLIELLTTSDNHPMIRFAANEIRQKSDVKAIEGIIQRFHSREAYAAYDLDVRASGALYEIGNITVEPLVKCLDSEDVRVQVNAIYTLGKIGDNRAVLPLISHIQNAGIEVRSRISDALIKIGDSAVPDLIKLLEHNDRDIKWIAAYTLGKIGPAAEPALIAALQARGDKPSEDIIYALGTAGTADSFSLIHKIYQNTKDDSVKAWSTISLSNLIARNYDSLDSPEMAEEFLDSLGEQLKPHMTLDSEALLRLGKIYVIRALRSETPDKLSQNITIAVKCFDLSIIEGETVLAKAYRLFYGSYLKLMTSRSAEIMGYVERDFTDLKKDAEKTDNKKEIMIVIGDVLAVLRKAYADRSYNFTGLFAEYVDTCVTIERFIPLDEGPKEEAKKLSQKEIAKLHTDIEIVQKKIGTLIDQFGASADTESAAQALRLSTELAKMDTGTYNDFRVVESCLKTIVNHMKVPAEEKSDLHFKILMISKNGLSQVEAVIDQISKSLNVKPSAEEEQKGAIETKATEAATEDKEVNKKTSILEYVAIVILVLLIAAVLLLALNKFGYIDLPYTFPISWLNRDIATLFLNA